MPKKSTSKSSSRPPISAQERARVAVLRQYESLKQAWNRELQNDSIDSVLLFRLHYQLLVLEYRAPWLKKEAMA